MEQWHRLSIPESQRVDEVLAELQANWGTHWLTKDGPADFGIYMARSFKSGAAAFYFSPSASDMAVQFGAVACPPPTGKIEDGGIQLVVGDQRARAAFEGSRTLR